MPAARGPSGRDGRRVQQAPEPIDVDEIIDVDIVDNKLKPAIDGVELIGSAARARAVGVNKGFIRNYRTTEDWKRSKLREERRLQKQKATAVDLTGDDGDGEPVLSRRSSTRGRSMQSHSAMDVDPPQAHGHRTADVIIISDDEGPQPSRSTEPATEPEIESIAISDDEEPGPSGRHERTIEPEPLAPEPEPEPVSSDSEESWFEIDYLYEQEDDRMEMDDVAEVPVPSVDKGKGRARDDDFGSASPHRQWRQREISRFDLHNSPGKRRNGKPRLWDWQSSPRLYNPLTVAHLTTCMRQRTSMMYGLACHRTVLSTGAFPRTTDLLCTNLTVSQLRESGHYKKTSGVVNKIAQSDGIVAIASATSGGNVDEDLDITQPPVIDAYNRTGNLMFWTGEKFVPPESHSRREPPTPGRTHFRSWPDTQASTATSRDEFGMITKYYTVNDVAFDPQNGRTMVTAGHDCYVRVWEISKIAGEKPLDTQDMMQFHYGNVVNDVQFRPASGTANPLVAISCFDGWIHFIEGLEPNSRFMLEVASDVGKEHQKTGSFLWGVRTTEDGVISSNNRLFASSEAPDDLEGVECRHVCFDISRKEDLYKFSTTESGDAMTLDSEGRTLALLTSTSTHRTLAMYDVTSTRSADRRPRVSLQLPKPENGKAEWEVNSAKFSLDDTLLALGLSDDRVLIYDTRFMGNKYNRGGPCLTYHLKHEPLPDNVVSYGVTGLEWIPGYYGGRGLGLLTGGTDGCVRLWDVGQGHDPEDQSIGWIDGIWHPQNVIATCDHSVACFSVGRNHKEHRLVVGDVGGEVYVLD